jgi:glycerol-3-phosphate O-acyltransferase
MSEDEVVARSEFLHQAALDAGARAPAWQVSSRPQGNPPGSLRDSKLVERALQSLVDEGTVKRQDAGGQRFYSVAEERRMALDFHKNSILHFLVAPAILAAALQSFAGQRVSLPALLSRARDLSRMLKHEFVFEPGRPLEGVVQDMLQLLVRWGLVERAGEEVVPVPAGVSMGQVLADLLRPFLEGIWVAIDALDLLLPGPLAAREWTRQALDRGRAAWLAGRVRHLEALSKATLENALSMLRERDVVRGARLELSPEWRSAEKIEELADEVDVYLQ